MRAIAALPLALLLAACATAKPAAPPRIGSFLPAQGAAPAADQRPLSVDALRSCLARQQQARHEEDALTAGGAPDAKRREDLQARQNALQQERKTLDPHDRAAIQSFNARAAALKADRDALNREVGTTNVGIEKHNALLASIDTDCRGHSYYQNDLEAVEKDYPDAKL